VSILSSYPRSSAWKAWRFDRGSAFLWVKMVQASRPSLKRSPTTTALAARVEVETSTRQQPTVLGVLVHSPKHCASPSAPALGGASISGPRVSSMWQPRSTSWACKMGTEAAAYMNNHMGNRSYLCLKTAFSVPDSMSSTSRKLPFLHSGNSRCLRFLRTLLSGNNDIQFLIASHSPILLAYPGAQIFSFDEGKIHEVRYQETSPYQIVSRFLARPDLYLKELFDELPIGSDE
jgi:hypothetical protein